MRYVYLPGAIKHGSLRRYTYQSVGHRYTVRVGLLLIGEEEVGHPDHVEHLAVEGELGDVGVDVAVAEAVVQPRLAQVDVHREVLQ